jgi:hypothetical protein
MRGTRGESAEKKRSTCPVQLASPSVFFRQIRPRARDTSRNGMGYRIVTRFSELGDRNSRFHEYSDQSEP